MFHSLLKRHLLIFIPCILIIGAMIPLATFAKSASNDQHRRPTAQAVTNIADIVRDGGFEKPIVTNNPKGFREYNAGQSFRTWTVASGSIDLIGTYWVSAHGAQSVDLDGSNAGTIYQDLSTISGTNYSLSFALAGNPVCAPTVKQMQVWWGSTLVATLSFDTTGHSTTNMGWRYHTYKVQATSAVTRLSFASLTQSACGPALDSVTVKG